MASKCKLTYFDLKAAGEPIRYLLSYGNIDFEDSRVPRPEWPHMKPLTPFGKVPFMEIDGETINQSVAICRYLGKQMGLSASDDWQNLIIDSTVDSIVDMRTDAFRVHFADEKSKAVVREECLRKTLPVYLRKLSTQSVENGGFIAHTKLTWADFHFAATVESVNGLMDTDILAEYPHLKVVVERIWNFPQIQKWRTRRPETKY